jgi:hypothetical protein
MAREIAMVSTHKQVEAEYKSKLDFYETVIE